MLPLLCNNTAAKFNYLFSKCVLPTAVKASGSLALVKGGTFIMGDLFGDGQETKHVVTLSDFYIGKTEVTFADFDAFCTATGRAKPDDAGWGRGEHPVINVDWYDAVEYCNWLSQQQKRTPAYTINKSRQSATGDSRNLAILCNYKASGYRLPTEAEWEYAAREGGEKVRFGTGKDQADPTLINFHPGSKSYFSVTGEYRQKTVEAGSLSSPNALGLHDMSGNVWEWCGDWYSDYSVGPQTNPIGPAQGWFRVLRGGGWMDSAWDCRAAGRQGNVQSRRD
ncbi:MAG: SUMF1/EgtB/PvdO family nonheme iron enzyme, partial [Saprospiraceae bacterium]